MEPNTFLFCRWQGCQLYFPDSETLLTHCTNDHVGRKITNNLCLDCHWEGCDVKTSKRDHITSHLRVHIAHKPYICGHCSKSFKRPQDLKKHEKLHSDNEEQFVVSDNYPQVNAFVPDYLSVYTNDNGSRREVSPQSASSELLATTPPSGMMMNHAQPQYNQLFSRIYNKQLSPDYNDNMAQMLGAMSSSNPQDLAASVSSDIDINTFNSFMGQLHGNIVPEAPPLFNNITPMQQQYVDPQQFHYNGGVDANNNNFMYSMQPMNYQSGFVYDQSQPNAFNQPQPNAYNQSQSNAYNPMGMDNMGPQQLNSNFQAPMLYPSLDFHQPDFSTYQQASQIFESMMGPKIQVSQDGQTFMAPQVDYSGVSQYMSVAVTPQQSEPRKMSDNTSESQDDKKEETSVSESKDKTTSLTTKKLQQASEPTLSTTAPTEFDSLTDQLNTLALNESTTSDFDSDSEQSRLRDAALIRSLVQQVNQLYKSRQSDTKTAAPISPPDSKAVPRKDVFPSYTPKVDVSHYPSLDDL